MITWGLLGVVWFVGTLLIRRARSRPFAWVDDEDVWYVDEWCPRTADVGHYWRDEQTMRTYVPADLAKHIEREAWLLYSWRNQARGIINVVRSL